ncbi:MAG: hypothetical protein CMJ49_10750 [Planctomycetaceae bacterium]|nr:hypothetical protein [Planctomycetaceae bacterium]
MPEPFQHLGRTLGPRRPIRAVLLWVMVLAPASVLIAGTYHAKPKAKFTGGIKGVVVSAKPLQTVIVIEPFELKAYEAAIDKETGAFVLKGIPPGEYDILIKTVGHVYESVTLETDPEADPPKPKALTELVEQVAPNYWRLEDFFNVKRILRLTGNKKDVRFFTCQTRTNPTLNQNGDVIPAHIRRFDLVVMKKTNKVWQAKTARHLLRQEVPHKSKDVALKFHHIPTLGGHLIGDEPINLGKLILKKLKPEKRGRYVGARYVAPPHHAKPRPADAEPCQKSQKEEDPEERDASKEQQKDPAHQ